MWLFVYSQDCKSASCKYIKCILKDIEVKNDYLVKVKTRIWSGTFISVSLVTVLPVLPNSPRLHINTFSALFLVSLSC